MCVLGWGGGALRVSFMSFSCPSHEGKAGEEGHPGAGKCGQTQSHKSTGMTKRHARGRSKPGVRPGFTTNLHLKTDSTVARSVSDHQSYW